MLMTSMQRTCRMSMPPMCTMSYCRSALPTLSKYSVTLPTSIGMKFRHSRQPISQRRSLVDLLSYFFLVYDAVFLSLQPFDLQMPTVFAFMDHIAMLFWTFDLAHMFFVSFYDNGSLEMRPAQIARRYFKTWFPIDAAILIVDVLLAFQMHMEQDMDTYTVRLMRIVRMCRLLRTVKVANTLTSR